MNTEPMRDLLSQPIAVNGFGMIAIIIFVLVIVPFVIAKPPEPADPGVTPR